MTITALLPPTQVMEHLRNYGDMNKEFDKTLYEKLQTSIDMGAHLVTLGEDEYNYVVALYYEHNS